MYSRTLTHTNARIHLYAEENPIEFLSCLRFISRVIPLEFFTHIFSLPWQVLFSLRLRFISSLAQAHTPYHPTLIHVRKHTHTHTHSCTCASLKRRVNAIISFFPSQLSSICLIWQKKIMKMRKDGEIKIKMKTRLKKHLSSLGELFAICYCACSICGSPYKHNLVFFFLIVHFHCLGNVRLSGCYAFLCTYTHTHTLAHARTYANMYTYTYARTN